MCSFMCRHNSDWDLWKARVTDIILGCVLAMLVGWLVLPWYASDEQLGLLADALSSGGKLAEEMYDSFYTSCSTASQVLKSCS